MKVLFLLRDPHPGLADHAKISAAALRVEGLSVDLVDCQNWMPTTTDPKLNKETAKRLNSEVNNFDLVHCFGYRTAYAMGEAFKGKKKWVFTAYDSPRTTHDYLIERLNFSRAGFCCSEFVKRPLGWAGVDFLKVMKPGIPPATIELLERDEACAGLGLDPLKKFILCFSRDNTKGLQELREGMTSVKARHDDAELIVVRDDQPSSDFRTLMSIADLVVFPDQQKGASVRLLRVMQAGIPVLVPQQSGLSEIVDDRSTGLWFESYDTLADMVATAMQMPIRAESMAEAGRLRVEEEYTSTEAVSRIARLYHKILDVPVRPN